jgi:hypothetical protein
MKKIILILTACILVLASCDQDNIGTLYEPDGSYVAFSSSIVVDNFLTPDNDYSVSVQIVRSDLSESATSATVELEMTEDIDGLFELESSTVSFESGSGVAYVKIIPTIPPASLNPATTYEFNLSLSGDNVSELFGTTTYKASLKIDYEALGTGSFTSNFFGDAWEVELLKANLGDVTLYKAIELYDIGYNMLIIVEGNNVTVNPQPAWYSSDYGDVYAQGSGTIEGKTITMTLEHYVPDLGGWDPETEVLILP